MKRRDFIKDIAVGSLFLNLNPSLFAEKKISLIWPSSRAMLLGCLLERPWLP